MSKTVVIAAAGLGSRLEKYTKYYNKAMCTLGPKPVISYIIEKFTRDDEIIVLLGYKGDLLRQVVKICYPEWNIKFAEGGKYEGKGAGPGSSLMAAKELLQKPFIYWANDTLIGEDMDSLDYSTNWIMVSDFNEDTPQAYRHACVDADMNVTYVHEKNVYERNGMYYPAVELCYVKDYEAFWAGAEENYDKFVDIGVNAGMNFMKKPIKAVKTSTWIDTGNLAIFEKYKKQFESQMEENVLEKDNEFIWFIGDKIVKFHLDENFIAGRIERHKILSKLLEGTKFMLPQIISYDKNVYSYRKEEGVLMPNIVNPRFFAEFIKEWFKEIPRIIDEEKAQNLYVDFYKNKTISRAKKCCLLHDIEDKPMIINGINCIPAVDLLEKVDWKEISRFGILSEKVHGDFHLDNVLYNPETKKFILLDWRQRFADSTIGDVAYDLGKLFMAFVVSYEAAVREMFKINKISDNEVNVDIYCKFVYTRCKEILSNFIKRNFGESTLTHAYFIWILIMFGSSGCHPNAYGEFLFYLGKCMLNEFYNDHKEYFIKD